MIISPTKTINSYIYFYHLQKFCVLPDYPESISDNMESSFGSVNALARTAPVFSYKNSGPRVVNVSFKLHRDMMNDLNRNVSNLKDNVVDFSGNDYIDILIKHLQAAALPNYREYASGSKNVIPPMVAIRFGNDIFIKGIVNGGVQCTYEKPILWNDKYAVCTINFSVSEVDPYDADSVSVLGSFRGITRTFKNGIYKDTDSAPVYTSNNLSKTNTEKFPTTITTKKDTKETKKKKENTTTTKGFKPPTTGVDGPPKGGA